MILPFEDGAKFVVPIVFGITNLGNRTAENVELIGEMSSSLFGHAPREISAIGKAMGLKHAEQEGETRHKRSFYRQFPELAPIEADGRADTVIARDQIKVDSESVLKIPVEATTKDGVDVSLTVRFVYSAIVDIKVKCRNHPTVHKQYNLHFRRGDGSDLNSVFERERAIRSENGKVELRNALPVTIIHFEEFEEKLLDGPEIDQNVKVMIAIFESMRIGNTVIMTSASE